MADVTPLAPPDLSRETYLTTAEAAQYTRKPSPAAFWIWAKRHSLVPCREGRTLLWLRVDLDNRLQRTRRAVVRSLRSA